MKIPVPTILAFAFAVITAAPVATFEATPELATVVIRDISVLDSATRAWLPHRDIVVRDTSVSDLQPAGSVLPPAKVTINGHGKDAVVYRGEALTRAHLNRLLGSGR